MPTKTEFAVEQIKHELAKRAARENYYQYVLYTNSGFIPTKFHEFLCNEIDKFLMTDKSEALDILLISTPPQHGKSRSITESLPSYYMGRFPDKNVIIAGYSEDFAKRFGRRNLKKLEEFGPELFNFKAAEAPWTNTEFESEDGGRCISRGILSGITGNPANLIIIDDPTKNMQEAVSEATRTAIIEEFTASIMTRIAPHAKLIVIQTRWTENDLFGYIKDNFPNVTVLNLPCEAEDNDLMGRSPGDPLCPEIGKGIAWLKEYKQLYTTESGERAWCALFQGRPNIAGGNLFLESNWKYYDDPPENMPYRIVSVDCTFKKSESSDFVAIQDWGKLEKDYYLLKRIKRRMTFSETVRAIRDLLLDTDYDAVYIEDKANGSAVIDMLSREFDNIVPVNPEGGKLSRAAAVAYLQETGHVYIPRQDPSIDQYVDEHTKFPNAAHDDEVDATTQALTRLAMVGADMVKLRSKVVYSVWTDDMWQDYEKANPLLQNELLTMWGPPKEWQEDNR